MPDAFLFDIGNVIITFDFGISARRLAELSRASAEEIIERVGPLTVGLELGEIQPKEFVAEAAERIGYGGDAATFRSLFADIFELNEPMVEFIASLKAEGVPLHLLSNTNAIHAPFFEANYEVFGLFDGRVYSHEVGLMKPDPAIYELVTERLSLDPSRTLYIDDMPENCAAGAAAGFLVEPYSADRHGDFLEAVAGRRA